MREGIPTIREEMPLTTPHADAPPAPDGDFSSEMAAWNEASDEALKKVDAPPANKQHVWGPRLNGAPGVRCEDCFQAATKEHQDSPCEGVAGTGAEMAKLTAGWRAASAPPAFDYVTRINHIAAESLGRIFGEADKAKVQAIIDEAVNDAELAAWKAASDALDLDAPPAETLELPTEPGYWSCPNWEIVVWKSSSGRMAYAGHHSSYFKWNYDIDTLPRGGWQKADLASLKSECDRLREEFIGARLDSARLEAENKRLAGERDEARRPEIIERNARWFIVRRQADVVTYEYLQANRPRWWTPDSDDPEVVFTSRAAAESALAKAGERAEAAEVKLGR